jgi:carbon monoxide dehydrogenase subunit G
MPMADRTSSRITVSATPPEIMAVIADFPAYPEWARGITAAEVTAAADEGRAERVRMTLEAGPIKDTYTLAYEWDDDDAVSWHLAERGTMVTGMTGAYRLDGRGARTEVTYELAVDVGIPLLGLVKRKAEKRIIDTALEGLKRRVERRVQR